MLLSIMTNIFNLITSPTIKGQAISLLVLSNTPTCMPICRQFTPPPTGPSNYRSVFCISGFAKANCILFNLMCVNIINRHLQFTHTVISNSLLPLLSRFSRVRLCATPQTAAHQSLLSLGFSRQEHWSGLPFPSPMHEREK